MSARLRADMSHRHSRFSTDGEQQPRSRTPSPLSHQKNQCPSCGQWQLTTVIVDGELHVSICSGCNWGYGIDDSLDSESMALSHQKNQCPSCGQWQLTTVIVDDELHVSICSGCNRSYGIDDSLDAESLAQLLQDEELCQDLHITAITCDQCLNDDIYSFIVVESTRPDQLRVMCIKCSGFSDIPLTDWENEGQDDDFPWMAEVPDDLEEDSESFLDDNDSSYITYSEDDHDEGSWKKVGMDVLPFSCYYCGNNEVDCFKRHFDAISGDLTMVTCLQCDYQKAIESFFGIECGHCGNSRKELFERHVDDYGRITLLRCFVCDKHLNLPGQTSPWKEWVGLGWTKIQDLCHIRRGDHVAWQGRCTIWHHGIVVDVPDGGRTLTVIHYNGGITKVDGHFASIRLETINVDPKKEEFYRIDYPAGDTYPLDEVVQRACSRLGEAKYNPFTNNCEHFAHWCKTGRNKSRQVQQFGERMRLASHSAASKGTTEGFASLAAGSLGKVGKVSLSGIRQRAGQLFGTAPGVVRNVKVCAMACNVAVTLAVEGAMFAIDAFIAYCKYKSGAISSKEFRRMLIERGCEGVGGAIGTIGGGILGEILIPVPILGGCVGCILGNLVGRFLGRIIGKKAKAAIKC